MTKSRGIGRGGKREGAGRKPTPAWLSHWFCGFQTGNVRIMEEAERMRVAASDAAKSGHLGRKP
jgi:hypothetical protein